MIKYFVDNFIIFILFCSFLFCFQAYASGCDIVILGSDFERLQVIPGAKHGNIQVGCVDCSMQQGKVCNLEIYKYEICFEYGFCQYSL